MSDTAATTNPASAPQTEYHSRCKVCVSPDRARIEHRMAFGAGKRAVARAFGISEHSVWRHWNRHVPDKVKASRFVSVLKPGVDFDELINDESTGVLETLRLVRAALLRRFDQALLLGSAQDMSLMASQLHRNQELVAKLTGELVNRTEHRSVSLILSGEYLELRSALVKALAPFPDARRAVAEVLHRLEDRPAQREAPRVLNAPTPASVEGPHGAAA